MNTLDKQKFNQYRKVKFYIAVCFWIFSLSMFAGGSRKAISENKSGEKKISGNRVEDEAIKIDIIINKDSNTDFENENEDLKKTDDEDGDLIYLDRIQDEEEEKQQKKLKKTNRIERFIKKIDDKVNPIIKFQTAKSYGTWYLIKTDDNLEKNLKNVRYDFLQEENGYRIIKSYFDPQTDKWNEEMQRGWIEEKKGNVYLDIEKKYFKNNRNEIVFFDKNYRYMIIRYYNGVTRVLSRYPNNNKISLENDELDEFEKIVDNKSNLKNLDYDVNMKSIRKLENERKKAELKKRTDDLERRLSENPASVFQIDTIGAKREFERRMRKEGMTRFETKDGTKSVEVIELNDEDLKNKNLKNKNKIGNNGKDTKK